METKEIIKELELNYGYKFNPKEKHEFDWICDLIKDVETVVSKNESLHLVSNLLTKYIGTIIESEGCDYIPQKGMQKYDRIKISDEEIDILKERAKIFSDC